MLLQRLVVLCNKQLPLNELQIDIFKCTCGRDSAVCTGCMASESHAACSWSRYSLLFYLGWSCLSNSGKYAVVHLQAHTENVQPGIHTTLVQPGDLQRLADAEDDSTHKNPNGAIAEAEGEPPAGKNAGPEVR